MTNKEWKRFSKNLHKAAVACSKSVLEVGNAFGRAAKILRSYKVYKAFFDINEYMEEQKKIK